MKAVVDGKKTYSIEDFNEIEKRRFYMKLNGRGHDIEILSNMDDIRKINVLLSIPVTLRINDEIYQVQLEKDGNEYRVKLGNRTHTVRLSGELAPVTQTRYEIQTPKLTDTYEKTVSITPKEKNAVIAGMPGKIVRVYVNRGDRVKKNDPLCIIEAMKMENEIVAPYNGTVTEVGVKVGMIVKQRYKLFKIEQK